MRITEWCAVSTGMKTEAVACATEENPEVLLSPVALAISTLGEIGAQGAGPFVAALAEAAIQTCILCGRLGPAVPGEVGRLVNDPSLLFGEPEFTVTWATLAKILTDELGGTGCLLRSELTRRDDPEEIACLLAYLLLSLKRIADQLGFDLSAAVDQQRTRDVLV